MKLLNKISLYYILNTAILFLLGLFAIYFSVDWIISEKYEGQLKDTSTEVALKLTRGIKSEYPPLVEIKELDQESKLKREFKDTTLYLESEKEYEAYRQLTVYKKINDKNYRIIVRTSLIEKEDLFSAILIILIIIMALLLIILSVINRFTARKIFKPFYDNLKNLELFSLHKNDSLVLENSTIDEFNELKGALTELSEKSLREYRSLKEFSEDLSHELQTPVAVIKAKTEMLLQKEFDDAETSGNLQSIINNADRLDKINRALILLNKLESSDLFSTQKILLSGRIDKIIENLTDALTSKEITLNKQFNSGCEIIINESLLDMLISNLMSNSIKHNIPNGEINIELTDSLLIIKNIGKELKQDPSKYFERFTSEEKSQNSLGLGLAIVKKICDMYHFKIEYTFEKPWHTVKVNFTQAK